MSISLHGGYAYTSTKRDASRREFRFVPADELPIPVTQQRPDYLLSDFNIYTYNIQLTETRSEEHTSELQSLMRISYAVFCLKKKKKIIKQIIKNKKRNT